MSSRSRAIRSLVTLLLVGAATAAPTAARQDLFPDLFEVEAGVFFTSIDTDLRLDPSAAVIGTEINLEDDLGVDDSAEVFRLRLNLHPGRRHRLSFGYYQRERDGSVVLDRTIVFGQDVFPVTAEVDAFVDTVFLEASYTYWLLRRDRTALGVNLGIVDVRVEAGLSATVQLVGGPVVGAVTEQAETHIPAALFGLEGKHSLTDRVHLFGSARLLPEVQIDDSEASALSLEAGIEITINQWLRAALSWSRFDIDVVVGESDFIGLIDTTVNGPSVSLRLGF